MYPPTLTFNQITLKAYEPQDEDRFVEIVTDKASLQFMGGATGNERKERKVFQSTFSIYERTEKRWWWIFGIYKNDQLCGHLEIKETEHTTDQELEIVYMIHPDARRQGLMTTVLDFLKVQQHQWNKRIIATVSPKNINSLALLEKWGIDKRETLIDPDDGHEYFKFVLMK